ncbi:hypothetical protein [Treponema endosymbiont of Eucomonympha sp.]|uniref:hypothetical protein n=1 Tax=Treponema endosymbiont of Eucomonympha sp. TaxID=1580831 RepID=UPI001E59E256|nr:hypothetical protein [Treponema endosymbiont of Eucomonympha sp.]
MNWNRYGMSLKPFPAPLIVGGESLCATQSSSLSSSLLFMSDVCSSTFPSTPPRRS